MTEETCDVPVSFKLEYKKKSFTLEYPNGDIKSAEIREFDGLTRDKYMNTLSTRLARDPVTKEVTGMKDYSGTYSKLLSMVLYVENAEGKMVLCPEAEIQKFPTSVQSALNDIAADLCDLRNTQMTETALKND